MSPRNWISWQYTHASCDLHLVNLLFQAHIQTAHQMSQRVNRFPNRDRVLEHLMAEGLFDRREPDHIHIAEVQANWLSVVLMERVLERVENTDTGDKPQFSWSGHLGNIARKCTIYWGCPDPEHCREILNLPANLLAMYWVAHMPSTFRMFLVMSLQCSD